jgi:hypothetical protein
MSRNIIFVLMYHRHNLLDLINLIVFDVHLLQIRTNLFLKSEYHGKVRFPSGSIYR